MDGWVIFGAVAGGLGFGTILSSLIVNHYAHKRLLFETKLAKYSNFIESYRDLVSYEGNMWKTQMDHFVSCRKQVELVGSDEIIAISQLFKEDEDKNQPDKRDKLVTAMREDLKKHRGWRLCS